MKEKIKRLIIQWLLSDNEKYRIYSACENYYEYLLKQAVELHPLQYEQFQKQANKTIEFANKFLYKEEEADNYKLPKYYN